MQQDVHSWLSALNKTVNRLIHLNPVTGFTINSVGFDIRPKKTNFCASGCSAQKSREGGNLFIFENYFFRFELFF